MYFAAPTVKYESWTIGAMLCLPCIENEWLFYENVCLERKVMHTVRNKWPAFDQRIAYVNSIPAKDPLISCFQPLTELEQIFRLLLKRFTLTDLDAN